jgi:hypothetical protein
MSPAADTGIRFEDRQIVSSPWRSRRLRANSCARPQVLWEQFLKLNCCRPAARTRRLNLEEIIMRYGTVLLLGVVFTGALAASAAAQDRGAFSVGVTSGPVNFDLSGTGTTLGTAVRAEGILSDRYSIELGSLFASPAEQSGTSTLIAPDALLRINWRVGRFSPFVGGGGGFVMRRNSLGTDWQPSVVGAGGLGFRLTDEMTAHGEMRLRGIGTNFSGSTAEWLFGLVWTPSRS